jgi:DNA-binding NarL/FixJ family response regulator
VLLIEAQATFRWGVRLLRDELPDITVVGEAGSGRQGLALPRGGGEPGMP